MPVGKIDPPLGHRETRRKIGSAKVPKTKRYKTKIPDDPVVADANFNIKVLEEEADQATTEFLQDIDNIFDPVKRTELAEKLDLTEDAILSQLQTISARKENQKLIEESGNCHLAPENQVTITPELQKFFDESVDQYIQIVDEVEEKVAQEPPPSEAEELASTLALTSDIFVDAKDGVLDVGKLTKLLANQPQILTRGSGEYVGRTPADDEQERHNKVMEEGIKKLIELGQKQEIEPAKKEEKVSVPATHVWNHTQTATREQLDKANETIAERENFIAQLLANLPSGNQEDPYKGCDPSNMCRQLLAKDVFKKFAEKHYKEDSTLSTTNVQVGKDFKKSKDYENLQSKIDHAMEDYVSMPLGILGRKLSMAKPYNLQMPSDATWVNIRDDVWTEMRIKKRKRGRPPKQ